ncbi:MAG: proline--tRNA ligase [Candidatus Gracilibacteria bacterium]|nr:proline--tRNA ligase [Candidatus Gracilibacteria bacterium]
MYYSQLFGKTSKEVPAEADSANANYLVRGGFINQVMAGVYEYLPLGLRVLKKVINIIREEMDGVGGQEILMTALTPRENWEKTGRYDNITIKYTPTETTVLGWSHEESVTPLAKKHIDSYKDLPLMLYQIQTKFRNEARAKAGILRGREFGMKDAYSFHTDEKDLDRYYEEVKAAYQRVYERCGLTAYVIEASGGAFSKNKSHEFSVLTGAGEDRILICEACAYAQNEEIAEGIPDEKNLKDKAGKLEIREAQHGKSVDLQAKFYQVEAWQILKHVVLLVEDKLTAIVFRGDVDLNEEKVARFLGPDKKFRAATEEEVRQAGLAPGFISCLAGEHAIKNVDFLYDISVPTVKNYITGANQVGLDALNVNPGRDFEIPADKLADFGKIPTSYICPQCQKSSFKEEKAIEAGNIFKLGTKYSDAFGLTFLDQDGKRKPVVMGCYGIGTTRMVGTIVEASHDEKGIIWPKSVAPFRVEIVSLGKEDEVRKAAEKLYKELTKAGIEVLYDDREESAGVKLNDADLIGIPTRLIVSKKTLEQGSVEWKERGEKDFSLIEMNKVIKKLGE